MNHGHRPVHRPSMTVLVVTCTWAAALALLGVAVAIAVVVETFGEPPGWFMPAAVAVGLAGIAATAGALAAVRHPRLCWALLTAGSAAVVTEAVLAMAVG